MYISFSSPNKKIAYEETRLALIKEMNMAFDGVFRGDGLTLLCN
jgi:hypothetical protein